MPHDDIRKRELALRLGHSRNDLGALGDGAQCSLFVHAFERLDQSRRHAREADSRHNLRADGCAADLSIAPAAARRRATAAARAAPFVGVVVHSRAGAAGSRRASASAAHHLRWVLLRRVLRVPRCRIVVAAAAARHGGV